jgi:hypothetical protein
LINPFSTDAERDVVDARLWRAVLTFLRTVSIFGFESSDNDPTRTCAAGTGAAMTTAAATTSTTAASIELESAKLRVRVVHRKNATN